MSIFNFLFKRKTKEVMSINILGKDYVVTRNFKGELFLNGKKLEGEKLSEAELIEKGKRRIERETQQRINKVEVPFYQCFKLIYELQNPYFGFSKKIEMLKYYLLIIKHLPIDEYYIIGKDEAVLGIKEYCEINDISKDMNYIYHYPIEFLDHIDNYYTRILLSSLEPLSIYWDLELSNLVLKKAIKNRIKYLIEGYETIKEELKLLGYSDTIKVDFYINKYKVKLEEYSV